jgi:hypothetical protein
MTQWVNLLKLWCKIWPNAQVYGDTDEHTSLFRQDVEYNCNTFYDLYNFSDIVKLLLVL